MVLFAHDAAGLTTKAAFSGSPDGAAKRRKLFPQLKSHIYACSRDPDCHHAHAGPVRQAGRPPRP